MLTSCVPPAILRRSPYEPIKVRIPWSPSRRKNFAPLIAMVYYNNYIPYLINALSKVKDKIFFFYLIFINVSPF